MSWADSMHGACSQEELIEGLAPSGFCHSSVMLFINIGQKNILSQINVSQYIGYLSLAVISSRLF